MYRPCFLVVDREFSANISTRKLIIETAKFNVITAYSGAEAIESARRFPAIDGVVLDTEVHDVPLAKVIREIKTLLPKVTIILICSRFAESPPQVDHRVEFFDPASLLELLQKLQPQATAAIQESNKNLSEKQE